MHAHTTHFSWKLHNVSCFSIPGLAATVVTALSCYVIETLHHLQSNRDHLTSAKNKKTISQSSILLCGYFIPLYISRLPPTTIVGLYLWGFLWLPYCKSVNDGFGSDWSNLKKSLFRFHFLKIFSLVWNATQSFFHIALMLWLLHHLTDDILSGDSSAEFPVFVPLHSVSGVCWLVFSSSLILCNLILDCLWRVVFVSHSWSSLRFLNLSVSSFHKYWRLLAVIYLNCFYSHPMLILFREYNSTNVLATFSFLQ